MASPPSAAVRYQFTASFRSAFVPQPFSYMTPSWYSAFTCPWRAALRYQAKAVA